MVQPGRTILTLLLVTFLIVGCKTRPRYVLDHDEMVAVTYDMLLTDTYLRTHYSSDTTEVRNMYRKVFEKHNISQAQYDSSFVWYNRKSEKMTRVYEEVSAKFKEEKERLEQVLNDSIEFSRVKWETPMDLWPTAERRLIIEDNVDYFVRSGNGYMPDSIQPGDSLIWSMRFLPLLAENQTIITTFIVTDDNDSPIFVQKDTVVGPTTSLKKIVVVPSTGEHLTSFVVRYAFFRHRSGGDTSKTLRLPLLIDDLRFGPKPKPQPEDTDVKATDETSPAEVAPTTTYDDAGQMQISQEMTEDEMRQRSEQTDPE